jgi:hypothetical protein
VQCDTATVFTLKFLIVSTARFTYSSGRFQDGFRLLPHGIPGIPYFGYIMRISTIPACARERTTARIRFQKQREIIVERIILTSPPTLCLRRRPMISILPAAQHPQRKIESVIF